MNDFSIMNIASKYVYVSYSYRKSFTTPSKALKKPLYGELACSSRIFKISTRCWYNCYPGYKLDRTDFEVLKCNRSAEWMNFNFEYGIPNCVATDETDRVDKMYNYLRNLLKENKVEGKRSLHNSEVTSTGSGQTSNIMMRSFKPSSTNSKCQLKIDQLAEKQFTWQYITKELPTKDHFYTVYVTELNENNLLPIRATKSLEFFKKNKNFHVIQKELKPATNYELDIEVFGQVCSGNKYNFKSKPLPPKVLAGDITSSSILINLADDYREKILQEQTLPKFIISVIQEQNVDASHMQRSQTDADASNYEIFNSGEISLSNMHNYKVQKLSSLEIYKIAIYQINEYYKTDPALIIFKTMPDGPRIEESNFYKSDYSFYAKWNAVPYVQTYLFELISHGDIMGKHSLHAAFPYYSGRQFCCQPCTHSFLLSASTLNQALQVSIQQYPKSSWSLTQTML